MTWMFVLKAKQERFVLSRILQVLETQSVALLSFHADSAGDTLCVRCVVSSDQDRRYRVEALLHRLHDVLSIEDDGKDL